MPRAKKNPKNLYSTKNKYKCLKYLKYSKKILSLLASGKITRQEELILLRSLLMYLMNVYSRITTPSIRIEHFLNQLKIHLLIAQMNFSNIKIHIEAINTMTFDTSTFDGMSRSAIELFQQCSMIESLITKIESSFEMIYIILKQITLESHQILVASIQAFRDTFDQFVHEFASKKEGIMNFLNSANEHIELMIRSSETVSSLESKIKNVGSTLLTASSNQISMESFLTGLKNNLTKNKTDTSLQTDWMKKLVEEYVRTQPERQIECPTPDIDSILREMSSISPQFELYRQSDDSPTARTYEQNLFDARMKKGLDMIHNMITNHNTQGLLKVCAYLTVLLNRCYKHLP